MADRIWQLDRHSAPLNLIADVYPHLGKGVRLNWLILQQVADKVPQVVLLLLTAIL